MRPQQGSVTSHQRRHAPWNRSLFKSFSDLFLKKSCHQLHGRRFVGVWNLGTWNGHVQESEDFFSEAEIGTKHFRRAISPNVRRLQILKIQSRKKKLIPYTRPFCTSHYSLQLFSDHQTHPNLHSPLSVG